jgi:hypothetical protein
MLIALQLSFQLKKQEQNHEVGKTGAQSPLTFKIG